MVNHQILYLADERERQFNAIIAQGAVAALIIFVSSVVASATVLRANAETAFAAPVGQIGAALIASFIALPVRDILRRRDRWFAISFIYLYYYEWALSDQRASEEPERAAPWFDAVLQEGARL